MCFGRPCIVPDRPNQGRVLISLDNGRPVRDLRRDQRAAKSHRRIDFSARGRNCIPEDLADECYQAPGGFVIAVSLNAIERDEDIDGLDPRVSAPRSSCRSMASSGITLRVWHYSVPENLARYQKSGWLLAEAGGHPRTP